MMHRAGIRLPAAPINPDRFDTFEGRCMRLLLAALVLTISASPAAAQWLDWKTPGVPRTADGKPNLKAPAPRGPDGKPDLTGIWQQTGRPDARPSPDVLQPW